MPDSSPTKCYSGYTTWFLERLVLLPWLPGRMPSPRTARAQDRPRPNPECFACDGEPHALIVSLEQRSTEMVFQISDAAAEDLRLDIIIGVLADPLRLTIIRKLLVGSEAYDHTCGWFDFDRLKSSLTHHFKALREAGLIRQRQYGLERRSRGRMEDIDARFPGLLELVRAWRPEHSASHDQHGDKLTPPKERPPRASEPR